MNFKGAYLGLGIFSFILSASLLESRIIAGLIFGAFGIWGFFNAFKEDK